MRLKELTTTNFKGGTTSFNFDGKDSTLFGDNGTGKTRQKDAVCWLFFDKDSSGRSQFSIKTLKGGKTVPKLDVCVSAVVEHDGSDMTLEKTMVEKWTKKHGALKKTFSGNSTSFSINGIPKTLKEYSAAIGEIATEEIFKKFSSPFYFAETLHWKSRRDVLMESCGDIPDDEILKHHPALVRVLEGRSIDDQKVMIENRNKKIRKEIESIPAIIEEKERDLLGEDEDTCVIKAKAVEDELSKQIKTLERNRAELVADAEVQRLEVEGREIKHELTVLRNDIGNKTTQKEHSAGEISWAKEMIETFRGREEPTSVCGECEQDLPRDRQQRALAQWKETKARDIEEKELVVTTEEAKHSETVTACNGLLAKVAPVKKRLEDNGTKIEEIKAGKTARLEGIDSILLKVQADQKIAADRLKAIQDHDKAQTRIDELGEKEKTLAAEFEGLAAQLDLIDKFTRDKVGQLEGKINSRFKLAQFKLFDMQINGTLKECCDVTDKSGVPFTSGLNSGARNNLGIDIINTLSEHYGISLPIIIDNAESVTVLEPTKSQIIRLEVRKGMELTLASVPSGKEG